MSRKLFAKQLEKARRSDGEVDLAALEELVVQAYDEADQDRQRTDRSISLMVGELNAAQADLERKITERTAALRKSRRALRTQNSRFSAALDNMAQGISMFDSDMKLVICNQQYLDLYKLPKRCGRVGTAFRKILSERIKVGTSCGDDDLAYIEERYSAAEAGVTSSVLQRTKAGRVIGISHQPMPGGWWVSTHTDVTDMHNLQDELAHLAYYDALTDLPNRNLVLQRLTQALDTAELAPFYLLFIDLDGFKAVNDTLGHASGDQLLRKVAERLVGCVTADDLVGRLGGDEYAIILRSARTEIEAERVGNAVLAALRQTFDMGPTKVNVTGSVGLARATGDGETADRVLHNADLALYAAKSDGGGGLRIFDTSMDAAVQARRQLEHELAKALENGEFSLNFQPILNLQTQKFSGFETLLRWQHPERGNISPAEFIPVAEELGLIVPIGDWVIREAFAEAARWPSDLRVAVNVSPIQFDRGNLVAVVMNALAASGLPPHRVEIEITESVFLANSERNLETLHQLHMLGVRIALDDFGTGFSALSYLLSFPFNKIKIDGSFVRALENAEGAHAILSAVSEIGRRLGMTTTAEGVETAAQLRNVHALGYTEVQGYLVSRPLSTTDLHRMLATDDAMPEAPMKQRATG